MNRQFRKPTRPYFTHLLNVVSAEIVHGCEILLSQISRAYSTLE